MWRSLAEALSGTDGRWEVTVEPLADDIFNIRAEYEDLAGNISDLGEPLKIEVDTTAPNLPFLGVANRTAGTQVAPIINSQDLVFTMTTSDAGTHLSEFNFKYRLYLRADNGLIPEAQVENLDL